MKKKGRYGGKTTTLPPRGTISLYYLPYQERPLNTSDC